MRLDKLLVERGLAASRERAARLIETTQKVNAALALAPEAVG